jgi:hypothetical protein
MQKKTGDHPNRRSFGVNPFKRAGREDKQEEGEDRKR